MNVLLKIALMGTLAQVGPRVRNGDRSLGEICCWSSGFAIRAGYLEFDRTFRIALVKFVCIGLFARARILADRPLCSIAAGGDIEASR